MSHKTNTVHRFEGRLLCIAATDGDLAESSQTAGVMTHSLIMAAEVLLHPEHLYSVTEVRGAPTLIPQEAGVYAWWFSEVPPGVPIHKTALHDGERLLYVGIAPRKPAASGSLSSRTLRQRLLNHCRGPIASSTLRRTLAVLLGRELDLSITRAVSGKVQMGLEHEARLTQWMNESARVIWAAHPTPWKVEDHLIEGALRLPLNIRGSSDPFAKVLSKLRSQVL
jgi:GIY-YIG catalytic domain-containing protein